MVVSKLSLTFASVIKTTKNMETYRVWITGTYHAEVLIEANSPSEAEDLVYKTYTKPMLEELVAEQGVDQILNVASDSSPYLK